MKRKMIKQRMMLLLVCMAVMLTACGTNQVDEKQDKKQQTEEKQGDVEYDNTDVDTITENEKVTEEVVEEENSASTENESADNELYPGPETVVLVNLRGDETTAYKLADGTYMDRIQRRFTYNGTDTWTDEDGVEWNEKVN